MWSPPPPPAAPPATFSFLVNGENFETGEGGLDVGIDVDEGDCTLDAQNCPAGEGCYLVSGSTVCAPNLSGIGGDAYDRCDAFNECRPGLACVDMEQLGYPGNDGGLCTPWCTPGSPDPGDCQDLVWSSSSCSESLAQGATSADGQPLGLCWLPERIAE